MMKEHPWVVLNGQKHPLPTDGRRLIDWLRDDMGLTGSKVPCGAGQCGGCSVLLDGVVVLSCCLLASTVAGHQLTTIEGLAEKTPEDSLLDAFISCGATQCGYCTPGMIIAARAFLDTCAQHGSNDHPINEQAVRLALSGNVCRCTGYVQIVKAILSVVSPEEKKAGTDVVSSTFENHEIHEGAALAKS